MLIDGADRFQLGVVFSLAPWPEVACPNVGDNCQADGKETQAGSWTMLHAHFSKMLLAEKIAVAFPQRFVFQEAGLMLPVFFRTDGEPVIWILLRRSVTRRRVRPFTVMLHAGGTFTVSD